MYQELNINIDEKQKQMVIEILNTKNLIVAYHSDEPKNGIGICTDGIAAAFIIKSINNSIMTVAHSHYDELAANKLNLKIIENYNSCLKKSTVIFSDTTISKSSFEQFLFYLTEMIPLEIDNDEGAELNIVFQDHHLGPMKKVITQILYFNNKIIDDLPEKLTAKGKINFKRIQFLIKSKKLFFTKITSNDCESNKQPSSELLLTLIKPLNILSKEQLFFITSCILSEKVSIFSADDEIITQGFINFKNIIFDLNEQEIIDLLDYIDDKLAILAQKINISFPFNAIKSESDYSSKLIFEIFSTNFIIELFEFVAKKQIPLSEKRIKVEESTKPLILLHIKEEYYFAVTPFPRQSVTRSLTLILEKVRRSIQKTLNIKIAAFLLPNDSSVVSVIPYNDEVYYQLNDLKSCEHQALPVVNFIGVGHVNAFVLKANNSNYSEIFKGTLSTLLEKETTQSKISKIDSVKQYLKFYYENLKLNITEINNEELLLQPTTSQFKFNTIAM